MPFTQTDLDKLKEAIATGAKRVTYADKTVEYHSLNEMLKLKQEMEKDLGLLKPRSRVTSFSKGLG